MTTSAIVTEEFGRNSCKHVIVHDDEFLDNKARIALDLIVKWGMIAGEVRGEDSSGRAKIRDLAPNEVVERACAIADIAIETFRQRGWIVQGPAVEELKRAIPD